MARTDSEHAWLSARLGSTRLPGTAAALVGALALGTAACAQHTEEAPLSVQLAVVGPEGPGLPADVAFVRVSYRVGEAAPELRVSSVQGLESVEGRRRLVLEDLPAHTQLSVRLEGQRENGEIAYLGSLGPLALAGGEHLKAQVVLSVANESVPLSNAPPPRFLHRASALPDGRVLISGGFGAPVGVTCPVGAVSDARCYRVVALNDAWLFDPNTLLFHEIPGGLLEARAGHTSTPLSDGRVLIAGGARAALVLFDPATPALPRFIPLDAQGMASASASFELFDPALGARSARDPVRGRFAGSATAPQAPAPLLAARFLHAAAPIAGTPGRVLLAGGLGSGDSARSYEIFDAARAGGYGTSATLRGELASERAAPSALALTSMDQHAIWIFAGNRARDNGDLAELWRSAPELPAGSSQQATNTAFPEAASTPPAAPHPEYAFPQALTARLGDGRRALVSASLPPFCGDADSPTFALTDLPDRQGSCSAPAALRRCYVLDAESGAAQPCATLQAHLGGAIAELSDGGALLSGGLDDLTSKMSLSLERFALMSSEASELVPVATLSLAEPRAYHSSTALPEGGALSVGGLRFDRDAPTLSEAAELVRW